MEWIIEILGHTPAWVYVLFVYLVIRGLHARKPAEVTPLKLAIIPALLTAWGLSDLVEHYGIGPESVLPWLAGMAAGGVIGWLILRGRTMPVDRGRGVIARPPDYTVLPLILVTFAVKYIFGVIAAVSPQILQEPSFKLSDLMLSGLFCGIFVGKFANYIYRYMSAPAPSPRPG